MREKLRGESWEDAKVRALCHLNLERRFKNMTQRSFPRRPNLNKGRLNKEKAVLAGTQVPPVSMLEVTSSIHA